MLSSCLMNENVKFFLESFLTIFITFYTEIKHYDSFWVYIKKCFFFSLEESVYQEVSSSAPIKSTSTPIK